ncbi:MAG TPA: hypothetical protein VGI40_28490 [Pirellulaceae bacterium]|jgi:hypothetical protein
MTYTVTWAEDASNDLADLWLNSRDRAEVARAADEIDRLLMADPLAAGESRVVNIRIMLESPLGVFYDVYPSDRKVIAWRVWRTKK